MEAFKGLLQPDIESFSTTPAKPVVQRTGASRFAQRQIERHRRLAPVADLCVKCLVRIQKRTLVKISAMTLFLTAGVLWLSRDSLRVQYLVQYHLRAERHAGQEMFAPAPSTLGQQVVAFLLRRPS